MSSPTPSSSGALQEEPMYGNEEVNKLMNKRNKTNLNLTLVDFCLEFDAISASLALEYHRSERCLFDTTQSKP